MKEIIYITLSVVLFTGAFFGVTKLEHIGLSHSISVILAYTIAILPYIFILRPKIIKKSVHLPLQDVYKAVIAGILTWIVSVTLTIVILSIGVYSLYSGSFLGRSLFDTIFSFSNITITAVSSVLFVPLFEELVFRDVLQRQFSRINRHFALIASIITFPLIHLYSPQAFIFSFFSGILITFLFDWYKNIIFSVIMHASINFCGLSAGILYYTYKV